MVPQCSVSFPQKIYFDSISFKFAGNDHISSRFTSDITYLKSSSWWPKMQNLESPRKEGRKGCGRGEGWQETGEGSGQPVEVNRHYLYSVLLRFGSKLPLYLQMHAIFWPFPGFELMS